MLILAQKENELGQVHIQFLSLESFQIHRLAILYHFEHTNGNIHLSFLFKRLPKLFCMGVICISNIFHG